MERILLYTITEQQENLCIIDFLKQQGFSRHILRSMKDFPVPFSSTAALPEDALC